MSWRGFLPLFLSSSLVFGFQALLFFYLSSVVGGYALSVNLFASYLACALGLSFSPHWYGKFRIPQKESIFFILFFLFFILILWFFVKDYVSAFYDIFENNHSPDIFQIHRTLHGEMHHLSLRLTCLLLPLFFFYGIYLKLWLSCKKEDFLSILFVESLSLSFVNLCCLFFLSPLGWPQLFSTLLLAVSIGLFFLPAPSLPKRVLIGGSLLVTLIWFNPFFIPPTNLHFAAKDYDKKNDIKLLHESWNLHSRVQSIEINSQQKKRRVIALGDGSALARIPEKNIQKIMTTDLLMAFQPQKVLILFAGAGAELMALHNSSLPLNSVTGVELNHDVIEHGQHITENSFSLLPPYFELIQNDARLYLETSQDVYDSILFSWSGATVAYYSGALMHTTQYAFTREAIAAAIRRLSENGILIIFGASKINLIVHLQELGVSSLEKKIILLAPKEGDSWKRTWDDHALIFSKKTLSNDLQLFKKINDVANEHDSHIVYFPGQTPAPEYAFLPPLLTAGTWQKTLLQLRKDANLDFQSHTDDRPFVYNPKNVFRWQQLNKFLFSHDWNELNFLFYFLIVIGIFIVYNTLYLRKSSQSVFLGLIYGFTTLSTQYILVYKTILYTGIPTLAFAIQIFCAQWASIFAIWRIREFTSSRKRLYKEWFYSCLLPLFFLLSPTLKIDWSFLFYWPDTLKFIFLLVIFFPFLFSLSSLFNFQLKKIEESRSKNLLLIFDVLGLAMGTLLAPLLISDFGMALSFLFVVLMLAIGFLYQTRAA